MTTDPHDADRWLDEAARTLDTLAARCQYDSEAGTRITAEVLAARATAEAAFALALLMRQWLAVVTTGGDPPARLYEAEPDAEPDAEEGEP